MLNKVASSGLLAIILAVGTLLLTAVRAAETHEHTAPYQFKSVLPQVSTGSADVWLDGFAST